MCKNFTNNKNNLIKVTAIAGLLSTISLSTNIAHAESIADGQMKTIENTNGWSQEGDNWYYYDNGIKKTGWLKENNNWYWLKPDGKMASNEWLDINGTWYWLKSNGKMASNEWIETKDSWYWLNLDGKMASDGWLELNGTWYWLKPNGKMASNEWLELNGTWYWLKSNGKMASNEWLELSGTWYWLKSNGKMASNEWLELNGTWYWLKSNGKMASNEVLKVDKQWYKFYSNGTYIKKNAEDIAIVKECDFLNVRNGPDSSHEVLGKVYTGEYVEVLEKGSNGWYKIQDKNSIIGWVSGKYITIQTIEYSDDEIDGRIRSVIDIARKQIGKPYVWGAEGPNSFDCSGFTYYVYKQGANIILPRVSRDQAKFGTAVSKSDLRPGDLVFFASNGTTINHVGLYIGNSEYIHSPRTGEHVRIDKTTSNYFNKNYFSARRVIQ